MGRGKLLPLEYADKTREQLSREHLARRERIVALTALLFSVFDELDTLRGDAGEASIEAPYGDKLTMEILLDGHELEIAVSALNTALEHLGHIK